MFAIFTRIYAAVNRGGLYNGHDANDYRDFVLGYDSNAKIRQQKIDQLEMEIMDALNKTEIHKTVEKSKLVDLKETIHNISRNIFKDDFEHGRSVHAEEAAICDAAWRGVSVKNTILYTTTYPCHLCAKHILAAGIRKVVYIEPYPKSKVDQLFINEIDFRSGNSSTNKLLFEHFTGVKPRAFRHVFNV